MLKLVRLRHKIKRINSLMPLNLSRRQKKKKITTTSSVDRATTRVRVNSISYLLVKEKLINTFHSQFTYELQRNGKQRKRNSKQLSEANNLYISLVSSSYLLAPMEILA